MWQLAWEFARRVRKVDGREVSSTLEELKLTDEYVTWNHRKLKMIESNRKKPIK